MRLNINLASQPYEDIRRFWRQWGSALALVGIVSLALLYTALSGWTAAAQDRRKIAEMREQIAKLDREKTAAETTLNKPENRGTRDQSQFLNDLIRRKAFSWTQAFAELEKLMPPRLHVVSMRPELSGDNQLQIKMVVAGDSHERALDLVRRMEQSQHFRQTKIDEESLATGQTPGDNVQFDISTMYVPQAPRSTP